MKINLLTLIILTLSCAQLTESQKLEKLGTEIRGEQISTAGEIIKEYFPNAEEAGFSLGKWGGFLTYSLPNSRELVVSVYEKKKNYSKKLFRDIFKDPKVYVYEKAKLRIRSEQTNGE